MITAPKLIFIDGIVGVGKSRLAQRLWLHLRKSGADAEWFAEPQSNHPLHDLGDLSSLEFPAALDRVFQAWHDFVAERRGTGRITLLDATLLQTAVQFLRAFNIPRPEWRAIIEDVLQTAEPLSPVLIYLRPKGLDGFMEQLAEVRGAEWAGHMETMFAGIGGLTGLKAHYAERLAQDLALIDGLLPSITLITDRDGWNERYAAACVFLGIETPEPPDSYSGDLALLVDHYREPESGVSWELGISDGRLGFPSGDRPHLIHLEDTRFVLEGRPIEALFMLDAGGRAACLRFSGQLRDDPLLGTEWYRVGR